MNRIVIPRDALFEAAKILLRKVVPRGVAVGLWLACGAAAAAAVPAFPGAQGGGAESVGGRGGVVIEVTNLNDSGPGSLRAAVDASGPRTVVFRVGGEIHLKSGLKITNPFITIAGQTAPGGGITLKGPGSKLQMMIVNGHDSIIRYLRIRKGLTADGFCDNPRTEGCGQNLGVHADNVIIDHVSSSWNQDEGLSVNGPRNVTFSYNIQAEALKSHSTAFWIGGRSPLQVTDIDYHHNLAMTHSHRVPLAKGGSGRFVNNLIYNGRLYFIRVGGAMQVDVVANKFKRGSMTGARLFHAISGYENVAGTPNYGPTGPPSIYLSGNIGDHQADPAGDQWVMANASRLRDENGIEIGPMPAEWRRSAPLADTAYPIIAEPVENIEASILPTVGASRRLDCNGNWVANRDSVDARLVNEYQTNTGRTSSPATEADVGGYPTIAPGAPCVDADHDGMPDVWDKANGLNPNDAEDRNAIAANEYTNLENYLNGPTTPSDTESAPKTAQTSPAAKSGPQNVWTLGIYAGPSPFELSPPAGIKNPVLTPAAVTDLGSEANILAHPFMVIKDSMHYLFFTVKGDKTKTGNIGLAESRNGLDWKYRQIVLKEPFILAYPCVVKWRDDDYMIPETNSEPAVRLYRAVEFPTKWKYEGDLVSGESYRSPSLVHFKDMWWMYTSRPGNETLRLFFAMELKGPWTEHPLSPVVAKNLATARPGGRPVVIDGVLHRMGQDYSPTGERQVYAYQVTEISPTTYQEKQVKPPVVNASSKGWNAHTMHHVDAQQIGDKKWIAAVDALGH